jgi:hypothetical protein
MVMDIVERLRELGFIYHPNEAGDIALEAADEIERLRVVVEDAVAWCERHDKEPYWLADARAALKEGK